MNKDIQLKGIYVRRCKCGNRTYLDRIAIIPTIYWLQCFQCCRTGKSGFSKEEAIKNWNDNLFSTTNYKCKS